MIVRFNTLFTLAVTHDYYEDGTCRDFDVVLPQDAVDLLRRGRMVARVLDGELHVLFEADDDGTPRVRLTGEIVRIGLRLQNPAFANFTDSIPDPASAIALYRNAATPASLDSPVSVMRQGRIFAHTVASTARPLTVTVVNPEGQEAAATTLEESDDREDVSFDLSREAAGAFVVREEDSDGAAESTTYYVDPELTAAPAFGVVEVTIHESFYTTAAAFDVSFEAAEDVLKYYLVVRDHSAAEIAALAVSDEGFEEDDRPEITFSRVDASDFSEDDLSAATLADDDATPVLFKSESPVSRRQAGRKRIQLSRNGDVLISNLPQPADRVTADVIVHVKKS